MLSSAVLHVPPQFQSRQSLLSPHSPIHRPEREKQKSSKNDTTKQARATPKLSCSNPAISISTGQDPDHFFSSQESRSVEFSELDLFNPSCSQQDGQTLDPNNLASLLQSCSRVSELRSIHSVIIKGQGKPVTFVDNNLISSYVRLGELCDAYRVFDKMTERDVVSWTAMLGGYARIGSDDEILRLFDRLIRSGVRPNSTTFVIVLNACCRLFDFELGKQIHARVMKGNCSNLILESALVYFYSQCGDLTGAFRLFDRMAERDVICWTMMITACAQNGYGDEALSLFSQMQVGGFCPNEFTICSVLKACGEEKDLKLGRQLHASIVKRRFKADVFIGSSLLGMYVKCGQVVDARKVFDKMPKRNTITWTSMISGYAQNGLGEEAINLFLKMKKRRIFANNLTIVSILSACGLVRSLHRGKEIHAQILKNVIKSNMHTGSTLVWFYCKCGEYVYAAKVFEQMPLRDVISWTAIISGYTQLGCGSEALQFLNDMLWEGVDPNPFTYSSALKACTKLEAWRQGRWIHASANKSHGLSNVFVGSALIDMYAKSGCIVDAHRVFDRMPERNLVSWKVMIIGYARNGLCKEALKLMYRMQAEGFKVDNYTLTTVLNSCGEVQRDMDCKPLHCLQSC